MSVPRPGEYSLYARKFWRHGPARFRFDDQPWHALGGDVALLDEVVLRPQLVVNWVSLGRSTLDAGKHVLRIELDEHHGASAWDAFVLTDGPFLPRGKLKPQEREEPSQEPWFVFDPEPDRFEVSPLDLRQLNEGVAGANGPIVADRGTLVHETTRSPVRFWGVSLARELVNLPDGELRYLARSLAKRGVNLVRIQGPLWKEGALGEIDSTRLAAVGRTVAALAREGIYSALCIYFPAWLNPRPEHGFEGYRGDVPAYVLPYADVRFADLYRGWWKQILTAPNPERGLPLGQDAAVAVIELVNEDSTLFWTFRPYETIPEATTRGLERRFGDWLKQRYGSIERAFTVWRQAGVRGDDAAAGCVGFIGLWNIANERTSRGRDTAEFLARIMRDFYAKTYGFVKRELGFRGSVVCSNWITADARRLGPLDKWANEVCDVMDHHGYYGGPDIGPAASYLISAGDEYDDASALRFDSDSKDRQERKFDLPIMDIQYDGKPSLISEINWPMPNRFRAELPFLAATYGALQGTAGLLFFNAEVPGFARALSKFGVNDPAILGQFPGFALAFRNGYVKKGSPVVQVSLPEARLFRLEGTAVRAAENLDPFRKVIGALTTKPGGDEVDALTYLVGPVETKLAGVDAPPVFADLTKFVDHRAASVTSITGELAWDYGRGVVTLNAERAQGAVGFLQARGPIELANLRLDADIEYGAVVAVSLDGIALAASRRILVQVMSEVTNRGYSAPGTGLRRLVSPGGPPLLVKRLKGSVTFANRSTDAELRYTALDANGYPTRETSAPAAALRLLPDALYYVATPP